MATVIFLFIWLKYSSISLAIGIILYWILPQVGQLTKLATLDAKFKFFKISLAALISSSGSSVKDTLIVLPIPKFNILLIPIELLINPEKAVPDSVIPIWRGYGNNSPANL